MSFRATYIEFFVKNVEAGDELLAHTLGSVARLAEGGFPGRQVVREPHCRLLIAFSDYAPLVLSLHLAQGPVYAAGHRWLPNKVDEHVDGDGLFSFHHENHAVPSTGPCARHDGLFIGIHVRSNHNNSLCSMH